MKRRLKRLYPSCDVLIRKVAYGGHREVAFRRGCMLGWTRVYSGRPAKGYSTIARAYLTFALSLFLLATRIDRGSAPWPRSLVARLRAFYLLAWASWYGRSAKLHARGIDKMTAEQLITRARVFCAIPRVSCHWRAIATYERVLSLERTDVLSLSCKAQALAGLCEIAMDMERMHHAERHFKRLCEVAHHADPTEYPIIYRAIIRYLRKTNQMADASELFWLIRQKAAQREDWDQVEMLDLTFN